MHTVDILAARCGVVVGHIYQPPFQAVGAAQYVGLSGSPYDFGVGCCVGHVEEFHIDISTAFSAVEAFNCNQVVAVGDFFGLLFGEVYDIVAFPLSVVDLFAVDVDAYVAVMSKTQRVITVAPGGFEMFT